MGPQCISLPLEQTYDSPRGKEVTLMPEYGISTLNSRVQNQIW